MFPDSNKALQRVFIIVCVLFVTIGFVAEGQKTPAADPVFADLEKKIEAGRLAETETPLLRMAQARPNEARVLELLGRLRLRQGRLDEALALYRRVLTLDPGFVSAKINYGIVLAMTGRAEDARRTLDEIDRSEIKDPSARLAFARALLLAGNAQGSLDVLGGLPDAAKSSEALPILAESYVRLGRLSDLDALIPQAKGAWSRDPGPVVKFAGILIDSGRARPAIELLRSIANAWPKNAGVFILLGKAEILEKDYAPARAHLNGAQKLGPPSSQLWYTMGQLEIAMGNLPGAVVLLKKASLLEPASTEILAQLVITAIKANQPRDAVEAADKLLTLDPNVPETLYLVGAAALQSGNLDKAEASLRRFVEIVPKDSRGCLALGLTLAAQKDQTEPARRQLQKCLEINPGNVEAEYQLGVSYKVEGDTNTAIQYLEKTVSIAPNYAAALRDLGAVYLQAGKEAKARIVLEKAEALDPKDPETHFQLGRLYNLIGESLLARKQLEIFQKLKDPAHSQIQ